MFSMMIYEDFMNYKDGVYEHVTGDMVNGHAVRAFGWGHDKDGHLYWMIQNQWGERWGNGGFANVKAG